MSRPSSTCHDRPLRVLQLTDSHLFAEADGRLLGMNTADSLTRVVAQVRAEQAEIDLLLATGDLSQDASPASYQRFAQLTEGLAQHSRWLPGNHDEARVMHGFCAGSALLEPLIDLGNWRILLLDSSIEGAVPGLLDAQQLARLDAALASAGERHLLVVLHHHPVPIGSQWMEPIGLRNGNALLQRLAGRSQVRALLWGHVHQSFDQMRGSLRLLASPSTCVQFEPGSDSFQVGSQAPGYRWLLLYPDGRLETEVVRVEGIDFVPDYNVTGY